MATWLIILLSVAGAVLVGIGAAILWLRVKRNTDAVQYKLNRLQDLCAQTGAVWLSNLLSAMVVGDARTAIKMLRELIEADDTVAFFTEKVARPMANFVKAQDAQKRADAKAILPTPKATTKTAAKK